MMDVIFAVAIGALFAIGVFQLLRRDLIKAAMGYSILFTGVNLFLLAAGAFDGKAAPYTDIAQEGTVVSDPLVQALILTAVVIGFGSYAILLAIISVISEEGSINSDDVSELQN